MYPLRSVYYTADFNLELVPDSNDLAVPFDPSALGIMGMLHTILSRLDPTLQMDGIKSIDDCIGRSCELILKWRTRPELELGFRISDFEPLSITSPTHPSGLPS